eukprot:GHVT01042372.1.p1 GENE.GHVT01042372.1~~GHVT01042372.1.p1  ORF type:complete len:319 (-),score=40.16 GHVT01042372.1:55-1011(-)
MLPLVAPYPPRPMRSRCLRVAAGNEGPLTEEMGQGLSPRGGSLNADAAGARETGALLPTPPLSTLLPRSARPSQARATRDLRIAAVNEGPLTEGIVQELSIWGDSRDIDVICVSEGTLTQRAAATNGYTLTAPPRDGMRNGAAVMIRGERGRTTPGLVTCPKNEPWGFCRATVGGVHVYAVYIQPGASGDTAPMDSLCASLAQRMTEGCATILAGDFNARPGTRRRQALDEWLSGHHFRVVTGDEPTHWPAIGTPAQLDLIAISGATLTAESSAHERPDGIGHARIVAGIQAARYEAPATASRRIRWAKLAEPDQRKT